MPIGVDFSERIYLWTLYRVLMKAAGDGGGLAFGQAEFKTGSGGGVGWPAQDTPVGKRDESEAPVQYLQRVKSDEARFEQVGFGLRRGETSANGGLDFGFGLTGSEPGGLETEPEVKAAKAPVEEFVAGSGLVQVRANGGKNGLVGVIETLAGAEKAALDRHLGALRANFPQSANGAGKAEPDGLCDAGPGGEDLVEDVFARRGDTARGDENTRSQYEACGASVLGRRDQLR